MFNDMYEYETQDLSKFDIFMGCFWLILGFSSLLTGIIFIILKLYGILGWAWWVILSPIWGFMDLIILIICFIMVGVWIVDKIKYHKEHRKEKDQK